MSRQIRVAIVGAGLGGVAAAVKLKRAGIDTFTVFEKASGPGGVWWQNTYPGCEVDVPSHAYSYSFMPYDWSGTHAKQPELRRYVADVIDRFGIGANFRFDTLVESATWNDSTDSYLLRTVRGAKGAEGEDGAEEFDVLVSAVGMLSDPALPRWPGLEDFAGPVFHTSRFDTELDLAGKRVAIVGTGSTSCQLGPALAPIAGQLDVYQLEPGHVLPKRSRDFDPDLRGRFSRFPVLQKVERAKHFRAGNKTVDALRLGTDNNQRIDSYFHRYIAKTVKDPETRAALTPDYPYGCKRPVFASTYYPMFNRDNVTLVPHPVTEVTRDGLIDDTGTKRLADVIILSTGYRATDYLATMRIEGTHGRDLHQEWAGEPWAFLGTTVPGFPNFFILYGPNTNGGYSVITQLEIQADALVRLVRRLRRGRITRFDTRADRARRVDGWTQKQILERMSTATAGCLNYYHSATGKNVTQWPRSHTVYRLALRLLSRWALETTQGGPS